MLGTQIALKVKEQLTEITGLKAETVSSFVKTQDGYQVIIDLLELANVPDTHDVLATYETQVDEKGNIISYQRTRRYRRNETFEKEEEQT